MSTPDAASADKPIFAAALQGNSPITANIADANAPPGGYRRLSSRSRGPKTGDRCPSIPWRLGERGGQHGRDSADHAAMQAQRHRRHAAPPRRRQRLKRAEQPVGLAAAYGRPASLGALSSPTRRCWRRDGARRTAFHWAAASRLRDDAQVPARPLVGQRRARRRRRRGDRSSTCAAGRRASSSSSATAAARRRQLDRSTARGSRPPTRSPPPASTARSPGRARGGERRRAPAGRVARWQSRFAKPSTAGRSPLLLPPRVAAPVPPPKEPPPRAWCARATGGACRGGVSLAAPLLLCASPRLFLALPFVMVPALVAARCCPQRLGGYSTTASTATATAAAPTTATTTTAARRTAATTRPTAPTSTARRRCSSAASPRWSSLSTRTSSSPSAARGPPRRPLPPHRGVPGGGVHLAGDRRPGVCGGRRRRSTARTGRRSRLCARAVDALRV